MIKSCKFCEKEFETKSKTKKYCGEDCLNKFYNKKQSPLVVYSTCKICGVIFEDKTKSKCKTYCSKECYSIAMNNKKISSRQKNKTCDFCGEKFTTGRTYQRFCCKECNYKWKIKNAKSIYRIICRSCGKEFETTNSRGVFCSILCSKNKIKNTSYNIKCKQCEKSFVSGSANTKYCSEECRKIKKNSKLKNVSNKKVNHGNYRTCVVCNEKFIGYPSNKVYCSKKCRESIKKKYVSKLAEKDIICKECGIIFHTDRSNKVFCSDKCNARNLRKNGKRNDIIKSNKMFYDTIYDENIKRKRRVNRYQIFDSFCIGITTNGDKFFIDKDDYEKIKNYCWYSHSDYKNTYARTVKYNGLSKKNSYIMMHRFILEYDGTDDINHKDNNTLNNRKENLEIIPHYLNSAQIYNGVKSSNTSGISGVCEIKSNKKEGCKYRAYISFNKKKFDLGLFLNKEDAIIARLKKEKELLGDNSPQKELIKQYNI